MRAWRSARVFPLVACRRADRPTDELSLFACCRPTRDTPLVLPSVSTVGAAQSSSSKLPRRASPRTPAVPRPAAILTARSPTSVAIAVHALRHAEAVLLNRLARSIASSVAAPGVTPFDALTAHQVAADAVARVHTQLLLLDTFTAATGAGGTAPASLGSLLGALGTLHALAVVEASGGVLLRGGALSPADAAAAHDAVDELCAALRPRAAVLAGVMAMPDVLLAPIALDVVAHYSRAHP